jgi:hypothetical protein
VIYRCLNVSMAMIKMCGNKEVIFVVDINPVPSISRKLFTRMKKKVSFCLSNDNENK